MTVQSESEVRWDRPKLERFKIQYKQAMTTAEDPANDIIMFEGDMFVLSYAKYLIEYLEFIV